ncbi:MAG: hypothetical protein LBG72_07090 [Spirochaetaceae bacterium]|nr:hypothetical protein [Spirochaetaceae bacterium]
MKTKDLRSYGCVGISVLAFVFGLALAGCGDENEEGVNETTINVASASDWKNAQLTISRGGNEKNYIVNINANITGLNGSLENTFGNVTRVKVTLRGTGSLELGSGRESNGSLLKTGKGQTLTLRGVSLKGKNENTAPLVSIGGGFYMESGTISDNTVSGNTAGGVYIVDFNGYFTMTGGTISGNTASSNYSNSGGGGVYSSGTFTMTGGTISGNTASCDYGYGSNSGGGGVYSRGTFTMTGGTISGNTASGDYCYGGGVYVYEYSNSDGKAVFTKSGDSIIYGNDASPASRNTASQGHAVYLSGGKKRDTTASAQDIMDSSLTGFLGGWE